MPSHKTVNREPKPWGLAVQCACFLALCSSPAGQISSFQAGDSSWQLGTFAVGHLDGSAGEQIVVPYRDSSGNWFLDAFKYTGQRLPGFPYAAGGDPINVSPTLYDLDHDGRDEILFTRANRVIALRGDGSVLWSTTVDSTTYVPNGGFQTVTNGFYWYPTDAWLGYLPPSARFFSEVSPPIVMDLAGTGKPEVITAWKIQPDPSGGGQDYNPFIQPIYGVGPWGAMGETWSGGVVTFDAATGRQNFVYHFHHLLEAGLAVGQANATGPLDVYALNDSDSVVAFDKSRPFGLWGKGMLHKQFGKNQRLMTGSYQVPIDVYAADIDGDGLDEVLVAGTELSSAWQPNETILDDDGMILWRRWLPHLDLANNSGWLNSASLIPINPDHDNHVDVVGWNHSYEITFRYWNGIELVDRPGWPKNFFPLLPTPPVVGDVDGDGAEEIVIGTYDPTGILGTGELRIYALDGTLKQSLAVPGGVKQIPALADVEGAGRLDVVYRSVSGRVYVQNFGSASTNLVSWATHRGNMRRDGNHGVSLYPPGTPMVTNRDSAYQRASFNWSSSTGAQCFRIYRAEEAVGPFQHIATTAPNVRSFTDYGLKPGWQYFYEVEAVYSANSVRSAPFAILSFLNSNLVANAGFERNENCQWDKWFTGTIDATNMCGSTAVSFQGNRSMQILLQNQGDNSSIAQYNQYGIPDSTISVIPGALYSFGCYFKSGGLSLPSEHWLEWSSTRTSSNTNDRPPLPYPFYFTPHFAAGIGPTEWSYVNRTFKMPAGFPNIELRHRYAVSAPVSGSIYLDNVSFRQLPAPSATNWTVLVPFGSQWGYQTNTPAGNWMAPGFDDSRWPVASAKFGAGSGPTNIATRLPQLLPAYYFRRQFVLSSAEFQDLLLSATCTDVSVAAIYPLRIFLNGSEVKSMIDAVSLNGNETRYFDLTPFISLLQPGINTIAVRLGNAWSDYDDVAFDISLKAVPYSRSANDISVDCSPGSAPLISADTPPGTLWRIESSDAIEPSHWESMVTFTNVSGGRLSFPDIGQGGRQPAKTVPNRFYRLVPY